MVVGLQVELQPLAWRPAGLVAATVALSLALGKGSRLSLMTRFLLLDPFLCQMQIRASCWFHRL